MEGLMKTAQEVSFVTDNCEIIQVPRNCFQQLEMTQTHHGITLEAVIKDDGSIESRGVEKYLSPIQKLSGEPNISRLVILDTDGVTHTLFPIWFDEWSEVNDYQVNQLIDYKTVSISIQVKNKTFSLMEALELNPGTVIVDQRGKEHLIINDKEGNYVLGAKINRTFLESRFTLKN